MKVFTILLTVIIIALGIGDCYSGGSPGWISWFIGWGLVLFFDICAVTGESK